MNNDKNPKIGDTGGNGGKAMTAILMALYILMIITGFMSVLSFVSAFSQIARAIPNTMIVCVPAGFCLALQNYDQLVISAGLLLLSLAFALIVRKIRKEKARLE